MHILRLVFAAKKTKGNACGGRGSGAGGGRADGQGGDGGGKVGGGRGRQNVQIQRFSLIFAGQEGREASEYGSREEEVAGA